MIFAQKGLLITLTFTQSSKMSSSISIIRSTRIRCSNTLLAKFGTGGCVGWSKHTTKLFVGQDSFLSSSSSSWNNIPTTKRWNSGDSSQSTTATESSSSSSEPVVVYQSPMGGLITRLKIVSITSCVMSVIGLPLLIAIKNGDFPTAKQLGLGGVAFLGATGSTVALHFVFGPYILNLERIPVRKCHAKNNIEEDKKEEESTTVPENDVSNAKSTTTTTTSMLKATTRSVFGWKNEVVFDPAVDVIPYVGARPFANFVAKGVTLYVHPDLLDDKLRQQLLWPTPPSSSSQDPGVEKEQVPEK